MWDSWLIGLLQIMTFLRRRITLHGNLPRLFCTYPAFDHFHWSIYIYQEFRYISRLQKEHCEHVPWRRAKTTTLLYLMHPL
jgi:hypothetical protein